MFRSLVMAGLLAVMLGGFLGCQRTEQKEPVKRDPNAPSKRFPPPPGEEKT